MQIIHYYLFYKITMISFIIFYHRSDICWMQEYTLTSHQPLLYFSHFKYFNDKSNYSLI